MMKINAAIGARVSITREPEKIDEDCIPSVSMKC
jgi:hypothetical protein